MNRPASPSDTRGWVGWTSGESAAGAISGGAFSGSLFSGGVFFEGEESARSINASTGAELVKVSSC